MDADLRALCIVFRTISRKVRLQKVNRTTMVGAQPRHSYTIKIDSFTMLHITLVFITNDDFDVHHQFRSVEFPHGWVVKSAHTRLINEKNLIVLMLYILVFITNIDLICYPRIYKLMLFSCTNRFIPHLTPPHFDACVPSFVSDVGCSILASSRCRI